MVHIVSILNLTRYETQVNRQQINIILKELTKSNEDIRALFNITNQLATQVQVQNIALHLRAMLANLRDCLHFMKQLANHVLEYIDTATTGTLTPHLIPIPDLQQMLYRIESELPLQIPPDTHISGGKPILTTNRRSHSGQSTTDPNLPNHQLTSTSRKLFNEIHHGNKIHTIELKQWTYQKNSLSYARKQTDSFALF